jgi:hypothetical protein
MVIRPNRFDKIIASLDGDSELFAELAGPVASRYEMTVNQLQILAENQHYEEILKLVHKLKSTWELYVDDEEYLLEKFEQLAGFSDKKKMDQIISRIINRLYATSSELKIWVSSHNQKKLNK